MSASRRTGGSYVRSGDDSALGGQRRRARQRPVGLRNLGGIARRLRRLDSAHRVGDAGVDPLAPEGEAGLADPDPAGELAHHLQRRDPLAPFDPRDVRRAAPREGELPLADPCRLAGRMKPLPDGNRIVVMRRPRTLQVHVSIMARERRRANCQDHLVETDLRALFRPGAARPSGWRRMPTVTADAMLATSHPIAASAGMDAFREGGNAVDAALAAAAALTVAEPTDNGLGGDAFAIVWHNGELHGLNGPGRSPRVIDEIRVDGTGPRSVTVPGAVRAWADLAERFGRLGLDRALARAAELAARGVACTPRIADKWARTPTAPFCAPSVGERFVLPDLAATLRLLAEQGPDALYRGAVAESIAATSW